MESASRRDLPDECWSLVFSRLICPLDRNAVALTCRRWRSLQALSRHYLRFDEHFNLFANCGHRLHHFLLQALHSFPNIFSITIRGKHYELQASFPRVFQHKAFTQLTSLDLLLPRDHMNDHLLQCLADNCPSLTRLSFGEALFSDAGMHFLAYGCPLLQFLNMSSCSITDKGIDVLLSKCTDMQHLSVRECLIRGWGFRQGERLKKIRARQCSITEVGLAEGLQRATSLQALSLPCCRIGQNLSFVWQCCKGLEALSLKGSYTLDDVSLKEIVEGCKNLRALNVSRCYRVTLGGWEALALSGRKLEKLSVKGCPTFQSQCLLAIAERCPSLQVLKVSDYIAFDAETVQFRKSRPTVAVKFYDRNNECCSSWISQIEDSFDSIVNSAVDRVVKKYLLRIQQS